MQTIIVKNIYLSAYFSYIGLGFILDPHNTDDVDDIPSPRVTTTHLPWRFLPPPIQEGKVKVEVWGNKSFINNFSITFAIVFHVFHTATAPIPTVLITLHPIR